MVDFVRLGYAVFELGGDGRAVLVALGRNIRKQVERVLAARWRHGDLVSLLKVVPLRQPLVLGCKAQHPMSPGPITPSARLCQFSRPGGNSAYSPWCLTRRYPSF